MSTNEQPHSSHDERSEQRWAEVPELVRADCESYLLSKLPREILLKWKDQHSDEGVFHFGNGLWVRNLLREQLTDGELPLADWDDYYLGVLAAVVQKFDASG